MAAILMVEPPSAARDELERALADAGHRVLIVGDGESALSSWRSERQELAILDEAAARLNGLGVALRMKAESPAGFMPVIIVSPRDVIARAAALAVADDVIGRPFEVREVVARVGALLRTRAIVDELRLQRAEYRGQDLRRRRSTGLRNRAFLGERIGEEFKRAVRYNEPLSLVLLAVEGMREVIDRRGIGTADRLLQARGRTPRCARSGRSTWSRATARTNWRRCCPTRTWPARSPAPIACAARPPPPPSTTTHAVVSMGIAFYPGKDVNDATDLMRMAARALERAREEGAGSICLYQHQGYLFQPK